MSLPREEYVEQAYFFRSMRERMQANLTAQELLPTIARELLSTTQLPMAVDFMAAEMRHTGGMATAMERLPHYFSPFQTFVVSAAESPTGRFDMEVGLSILELEAEYRSGDPQPSALFLYEFECISRNRLGYDKGLKAIAQDAIFDADWKEWIQLLSRQIGIVDFADLIYIRSEYCKREMLRRGLAPQEYKPVLFGEKEGKIASANRKKDPLFMFAAFQRQLNYPAAPRAKPPDDPTLNIHEINKRFERLEFRVKLLEEEGKGGIDLGKLYGKPLPD